jgi:hypothetical protein
MKLLCVCLLSRVLFASYQQPIAVQRFRSALESTMSVTAQMVNPAITAIHDKASTTRNKLLTLEAWTTVLYHCCNLEDQLGFSMSTLTRGVKLFGSIIDSKVSGGNSSGVHFCIHHFNKCDKDGRPSSKLQEEWNKRNGF